MHSKHNYTSKGVKIIKSKYFNYKVFQLQTSEQQYCILKIKLHICIDFVSTFLYYLKENTLQVQLSIFKTSALFTRQHWQLIWHSLLQQWGYFSVLHIKNCPHILLERNIFSVISSNDKKRYLKRQIGYVPLKSNKWLKISQLLCCEHRVSSFFFRHFNTFTLFPTCYNFNPLFKHIKSPSILVFFQKRRHKLMYLRAAL